MKRVSFRVEGRPVGQPRVRHAVGKNGRVVAYGDKNHAVVAYRDAVAVAARLAVAGMELSAEWLGPIEVSILFVMPRMVEVRQPDGTKGPPPPGRHRSVHKPDVDNLCKAVLDGMKEITWHDDCQVVKLVADKWHGSSTEKPFTMVEVRWV